MEEPTIIYSGIKLQSAVDVNAMAGNCLAIHRATLKIVSDGSYAFAFVQCLPCERVYIMDETKAAGEHGS
jgi:hypothetical protein